MKKIFLSGILFAIFSMTVFSSTVGEKEFECPICTCKFTYRVQFSFSLFGQYLDLKPAGAAIVPSPMPKCKECGFVFDDEYFTAEEIKILKKYLSKKSLPDLKKNYPNYYYLAKELEIAKAPIDEVAYAFLQSLWENKNEKNQKFLMKKTLEYMKRIPEDNENYDSMLLVQLDLERRSGNFKKAKALVEKIKQKSCFHNDTIVTIIEYQEKLIEKKDLEEHLIPLNS